MIEFIAEIADPRCRDLEHARQLIRDAARAGCAAVNFPLFRVEQVFASQILWVSPGHRQWRQAELPRRFIAQLSQCARENGLKFGVTPFDLETVNAVQTEVDFFVVDAHELPWLDLVNQTADTGLPLVLCTAMADAGEAWGAVETALEAGCTDLTLLHGVDHDLVPEENCNLAAIGTLREMLVREFAPMYPDVELKAGWSDNSASPGVIARAVNHWGCDAVGFHLDPGAPGQDPVGGRFWTAERIAEVIAGGYLPVRRDSDGTGRVAPGEIEMAERTWRADPGDGLRPIAAARKTWPQTQPEADRHGPDVYLVPDGPGLGAVSRCVALAESLRDDHDADVLFLIRGAPQQIRFLDRHGFAWLRFDTLDSIVGQIVHLETFAADATPSVCVLDLPEPVGHLVDGLKEHGLLTVVVDEPECAAMDLGLMPVVGWQNGGSPAIFGGSEYLLLRDDVVAYRSWQPAPGATSAFPRVVVCYGATDPNDLTTRTLASLHQVLRDGNVQVVVNPAADRHDLVAQILKSRFPTYDVVNTGDALEPILAAADVVVTTLGVTGSEALCLGVPVLMLGNYPADAEHVATLAETGAVVDLGFHDNVTDDELTEILRGVFADADRLSRLRFCARELADGVIDGRGAARVADLILKLVRDRDNQPR